MSFKLNDNKSISILNNLNFSLPNRGLFFIYGKSGCGKSTLLNLLEGLMKPTKGDILINNKSILNFNEKERCLYRKNDIGIIFQSINLLNDLTVFENLKLTLKIKGINNLELIDVFLNKYSLMNLKNKIVKNLSGGEKQRIAIIRALINNPKIIFADEPTGSLDVENSKLIMDDLKEISKDKLVIIVSHDNEIIQDYSDGELSIVDGNQFYFKRIETDNNHISENKINNKSDFIDYFISKKLKKNFSKNIITFLCCCFSLLIIFFSIGIDNGLKKSINNLPYDYLNITSFNISKIEYETISESNLKLQKLSKPSNQELNYILKDYKNYEIGYNLDFFFSNNLDVIIEEENFNNIEFVPVNNLKPNNVVYVNNAFKELYETKCKGSCLNKFITLHLFKNFYYDSLLTFNKGIIEERFETFLTFDIEQINYEFNYLNTPKVYYSYNYFINILKDKLATKISKTINKNITFYDLLTIDEEFSSYKTVVYLDSVEDAIDLYKSREEFKNFSINNLTFENINSFKELSEILFEAVKIFIFISLFSSLFIIAFLAFYSYIFNRKESAILSILGARESDISFVYIFEQLIVSLISSLIIFISFRFLEKPINYFIYQQSYIKDVISFPHENYKLIVLILFLFMSLVFIFVGIPIIFTKKKELYKELKEE